MKKIIFISILSIILNACATIYGPNTSKLVQELELGMTKQEATQIMGDDYFVESRMKMNDKTLEIIHYRSTYYPDYLLHFADGILFEFHRYIPRTDNSANDKPETEFDNAMKYTAAQETFGDRKKIKKDIFGNTVVEDSDGNKTTIKKNIHGNTIIEDEKGNEKTVKKDIFGNTIIEDDQGNKTTIKKNIHGDIVVEDEKGNEKKIKKDIFGNYVIE